MPDRKLFAAIVLLLGVGLLQIGGAPAAAQQLTSGTMAGVSTIPITAGQLRSVDSNGAWVFRKQVNEVTVMFTATHKGKYVNDLQRQDVQVRDDKKPPAEIMDFRNEQDLPLRLGLLVDTSGSVNDRFRFEQRAASQFLKEVVDGKQDQIFVASFSHKVRMVKDFTHNPGEVSKTLQRLHDDQGDTAVFDSIIYACNKLANSGDQQPVARVLVLVSDGDDNASIRKLEQAVAVAQADEVTIYTISTNDRGMNLIGDDALQKLAEQSGGRALFPTSTKQVAKAFGKIRDELRNRYAVSYRPAEFKPDGRFRRIRIVARQLNKKLHVHARKGYYARPAIADMASASPK